MFSGDKQTVQRMAPMLQRVLILDPNPQSAKLLSELMRDISRAQVWIVPTVDRALKQASVVEPQIIFVEHMTGVVDGLSFTRKLRRGTLPCRQAPVIMVTGEATAQAILAARDSGVHEFLRKPFSLKDLLRRLEAVTLRTRDWVEGIGYVGPDRRRFNSGDYTGPLKRGSDAPDDPEAARLQQALRILRSAVGAIERDPQQALRAMIAQAVIIQKVAAKTGDSTMLPAASTLYRRLSAYVGGPPPTSASVKALAEPLLAYLKEDASPRAAA